jgi:hypothetical protein
MFSFSLEGLEPVDAQSRCAVVRGTKQDIQSCNLGYDTPSVLKLFVVVDFLIYVLSLALFKIL